MAAQLSRDILKFSPGSNLIVGTDDPTEFEGYPNVIAFHHNQAFSFNCYNDKLFVVSKALTLFQSAIYIDADTSVKAPLPENIDAEPGLTVLYKLELLQYMKEIMLPSYFDQYKLLSEHLGINLPDHHIFADSMYLVTKHQNRELVFLKTWELIAKYCEAKGVATSDCWNMAFAAAITDFPIISEGPGHRALSLIESNHEHFFASGFTARRTDIFSRVRGHLHRSYLALQAKLRAIYALFR